VFDASGARGVFLGSGLVLLAATLCVFAVFRWRALPVAQ